MPLFISIFVKSCLDLFKKIHNYKKYIITYDFHSSYGDSVSFTGVNNLKKNSIIHDRVLKYPSLNIH